MYESRHQRPISHRHFLRRLAVHWLLSSAVVAGSLFLGMVGYVQLEGLTWTEAFLNASMLLGGMGPVDAPRTEGGKLFAGFYALYAGLVFLIAVGFLLAPAFHRMLHRFHWGDEGKR
jgi:hypothetical protein